MISFAQQFKERWWIWAIPLLFVAMGLGFLGNYLMALSGQGKSLLANVDSTEVELRELENKNSELERRIEALQANRVLIDEFYDQRLSTESRRLTQVYKEIEDLATLSGLPPSATSYADDALSNYRLLRKTLSFSVEGTYAQLRRLIHLLEESKSFLTLEQVGLSEASGSQRNLRINLRLSTLFAEEASP